MQHEGSRAYEIGGAVGRGLFSKLIKSVNATMNRCCAAGGYRMHIFMLAPWRRICGRFCFCLFAPALDTSTMETRDIHPDIIFRFQLHTTFGV